MAEHQLVVFFLSQEPGKAKPTFYINTVKLFWNLFTGEWVIATQFGEKLAEEPDKIFSLSLVQNSASAVILFKGKKQLQEYRECSFNSFYKDGLCQPCADASFTYGFQDLKCTKCANSFFGSISHTDIRNYAYIMRCLDNSKSPIYERLEVNSDGVL